MSDFICADSVRDDCDMSSPLAMFLEAGVPYQSQRDGLRWLWKVIGNFYDGTRDVILEAWGGKAQKESPGKGHEGNLIEESGVYSE